MKPKALWFEGDEDLVREVDDYAAQLAKELRGVRVSRSSALRHLVRRGLQGSQRQ